MSSRSHGSSIILYLLLGGRWTRGVAEPWKLELTEFHHQALAAAESGDASAPPTQPRQDSAGLAYTVPVGQSLRQSGYGHGHVTTRKNELSSV